MDDRPAQLQPDLPATAISTRPCTCLYLHTLVMMILWRHLATVEPGQFMEITPGRILCIRLDSDGTTMDAASTVGSGCHHPCLTPRPVQCLPSMHDEFQVHPHALLGMPIPPILACRHSTVRLLQCLHLLRFGRPSNLKEKELYSAKSGLCIADICQFDRTTRAAFVLDCCCAAPIIHTLAHTMQLC